MTSCHNNVWPHDATTAAETPAPSATPQGESSVPLCSSETERDSSRVCPCSVVLWGDETMAPRISVTVKEVKDTNSKVFVVDVWVSGRHHVVERRYTEFEELHKQIKKMMKTPEFPPKKVLKWNVKVLEQRQKALEAYLQGVVSYEAIPKAILEFLEIKFDNEVMDFDKGTTTYIPSHQAVVTFPQDAYLQDLNRGTLPDIIAEGVTIGLFDSDYTTFPS